MSSSVNKVILIGNLGRDPEVRRTQSNEPVATLRIATTESWKDKATGERKDRTEWHTVVIFNTASADFAEKYLKKGAKVYVEGQLQTRKWTDQSGVERYTTEVVLQKFKGELTPLDKRESNRPPAADSQDDYGRTTTRESTPQNQNYGGQIDDDIPF